MDDNVKYAYTEYLPLQYPRWNLSLPWTDTWLFIIRLCNSPGKVRSNGFLSKHIKS